MVIFHIFYLFVYWFNPILLWVLHLTLLLTDGQGFNYATWLSIFPNFKWLCQNLQETSRLYYTCIQNHVWYHIQYNILGNKYVPGISEWPSHIQLLQNDCNFFKQYKLLVKLTSACVWFITNYYTSYYILRLCLGALITSSTNCYLTALWW